MAPRERVNVPGSLGRPAGAGVAVPGGMLKRIPVIALLAVAGAAVLGSVSDAGKGKKGKQVKFVSVHPIPKGHGGGVCHIEAPHVHAYTPADVKVQYRVHDDHYYFVGDPVAYGWDGPRHTYYGHHPVHVDVVLGEDDDDHVEYCYLDGAHFHSYEPPADVKFEVRGDAYWYVGDMPEVYVEARAELDPIDVVYEPIVYARPVVVVEEPPPMWVGVRYTVAAPVVEIETPKVRVRDHRRHDHVDAEVHLVAPSLSIEVGVPSVVVDTHVHGGVIVEGHGHGHWKHKKHKKGKRVKLKSKRRGHYGKTRRWRH